MAILNLHLKNFRNFSSKSITFDRKLSVITGPNGCGKSNILEAIALLSGIRPLRAETDLDLVKFGKSEARIEGEISGFEKSHVVINFLVIDEWSIKKSFLVNSLKKRFSDLRSLFSMVIFSPTDLELVAGAPTLRRRFLDILLSATDRVYGRDLLSYSKVLTRRNRLLAKVAEGKSKAGELDFWDDRLLEHGQYLSNARHDFFDYLNFMEKALPGGKAGELSWQLKQSILSGEKLKKDRERDIAAGMTLSGPQRDDFRFFLKGRDLAYFGSRGEQRMAVLALKIAEVDYYQVKTIARPILALDDIFSELDWEHREAVLAVIDKQQTIITAAEKESVPKLLLKKAKIVNLG